MYIIVGKCSRVSPNPDSCVKHDMKICEGESLRFAQKIDINLWIKFMRFLLYANKSTHVEILRDNNCAICELFTNSQNLNPHKIFMLYGMLLY